MNKTKTSRGFGIIEFKDANGEKCTLQQSSVVRNESLIWFGSENIGLRGFNQGWREISEHDIMKKFNVDSLIANTRMHLTQSQIKELLPHLIQFAETGEI